MASGTLGTPTSLTAATLTTLYTVPANIVTTLNFNLVNTGTTTAKVRVAIAAGTTPTAAEWVEYDYNLPPPDESNRNVLERTGFAVEAGKRVVVYSDIAGIAARVHGFEEGV